MNRKNSLIATPSSAERALAGYDRRAGLRGLASLGLAAVVVASLGAALQASAQPRPQPQGVQQLPAVLIVGKSQTVQQLPRVLIEGRRQATAPLAE
ncbi:hypothetical protein [Roseateles sp.]|uniref:hypothetical protein n=1 Tax=Roseateles sp. TaxID=1971397 RepID=UPI003919E511